MLAGRVIAILDADGNVVVSYIYDAWGAPLWCTGELAETLGKVQPFRYRGYVFDEETGCTICGVGTIGRNGADFLMQMY